MKITEKETKTICSNPTNPHHAYFGWPSVTRLQNGQLAMVASGFRNQHVCPFGKVVICYSDDEGQTWTRPAVVIDTPLDDRDAGIMPFGESSVIITSFNNKKELQRWANNLTPETCPNIGNQRCQSPYISGYLDILDEKEAEAKYLGSTFVISNDFGKTFGDIMRIPVSAPHGPAKLTDDTLLYVGRISSPSLPADDQSYLHVYKLHADGTSEKLSEIDPIPDRVSCEPHAIVLSNGTILVHIRVDQGIFTLFQCESYDGGKTFTKPHQILDDFGGAPAHLLELRDGTLLSVYGHRRFPYAIKAMFSYDHGQTWDTDHDIYVFDDPINSDLGYPASVELENGDILTVFYTREGMPNPSVIKQTIWSFER